MHHPEHAREVALLEEALTVLFCLVDDIYQYINPNGWRYESLKKLTDSEVITLALFQQLRGVESQRSFLRDASRFFSHLFPAWSASLLPPCTAGSGSCDASWSPCDALCSPNLWVNPRPYSSTRRCLRFCIPGKLGSPRVLWAPRGRGGTPFASMG
jgi:hypothetical protein